MKYQSKRTRKAAGEAVAPTKPLPMQLKRQRSLSKKGGNAAADFMDRVQCVGLARSRLKRYWLDRMAKDGHEVPAVDDPNYRYSEITELARRLGYETDSKTLPDSVKADCRCRNQAIAGALVCRKHGGSLKVVQNKAKENFYAMLFPAQQRMMKVITKGKHDPSAISAAKEIFAITGMHKLQENSAHGYSDDMINRMAEIFTEEELEMFIKLNRKLEATQVDEESDTEIKTINVTPNKMVELISGSKKARRKSA